MPCPLEHACLSLPRCSAEPPWNRDKVLACQGRSVSTDCQSEEWSGGTLSQRQSMTSKDLKNFRE